MKKFLIIASVAAIAMTSCTKEAADNTQTAANAVEFRTVFEKTKAAPQTTANMLSFNVNASIGTATTYDFMKDVTVTKRDGAWGFAPAKYWPSTIGTGVNFTAYSPADSPNVGAITVASGGVTSFTYTAPIAGSTTEDFVVAHKKVTAAGVVDLNFKHVLSMVSFRAKNDSPGVTYVIEKIELVNLANSAKLTVTPTATASDLGYAWSVLGAQTSTFAASVPPAGFVLEPMATPAYKVLTSDNEYLMMVPQTGIAGSVLRVTYHAYDGYGFTIQPTVAKDFVLTSKLFAAGIHNQFSFTFNAGTAVSFSADVAIWPAAATDVPVVAVP